MPVLTIPVHDFPYSNFADDCLIDELTPENNAVNEINIDNPLDSKIYHDHIDYNVLGSIDPDTTFNQCFPSDDTFSLFNIRSLPKNMKKCDIFWNGYIISLPSYLLSKLRLPSITHHYTIV